MWIQLLQIALLMVRLGSTSFEAIDEAVVNVQLILLRDLLGGQSLRSCVGIQCVECLVIQVQENHGICRRLF